MTRVFFKVQKMFMLVISLKYVMRITLKTKKGASCKIIIMDP